jgi:hypothetical protein
LLSDLATLFRYTGSLPAYLRNRMRAADADALLRTSLADREGNFIRIVERGIYDQPSSPYRALLKWAGIELGDIRTLVATAGLEGALGRLYDAGVRVSIDEVKGRRAIERQGLHIPASKSAFDNPLLKAHYEAQSSGSRGPRTRVMIDLSLLEHEAAYVHQYLDAYDLWKRPYAVWRPIPPTAAAVKWLMRLEKLGKPLDRWFSHTNYLMRDEQWKFALFTFITIGAGRALGRRFPVPQHVPGDSPGAVTDWLVEMKALGHPATLDTMVSSAVRVCMNAIERGADISGTMFRVGGEPLTDAKAGIIESAGCTVICFYSITELSFVGSPCADGDGRDDVHLLSDKIAAIERPTSVGSASVDALVYTTLLPSSPKLMLNVESGDFAHLFQRECNCPMGRLGFTTHLRNIRSYEKVTSEGVTFLGTELLRIIEEVLPAEFGGGATDYQFMEREESGLTRTYIVASPRLGPIDETAMKGRILATLRAYPGGIDMTDVWTRGDTLRVLRSEPFRTESAKILPLYLRR